MSPFLLRLTFYKKERILSPSFIYYRKQNVPRILYIKITLGFKRTISHISIGRIQRELKSITNIGFRNNLKILEKNKYLVYKEYNTGLYEYHIY